MDMGALIIVVGLGATIDAISDIQQKKEPIVTLLGASVLLLILATIGRVTGQYGIATALAFLYLIASLLTHYKTLPMITGLINSAGPATGISQGVSATLNMNNPRQTQTLQA